MIRSTLFLLLAFMLGNLACQNPEPSAKDPEKAPEKNEVSLDEMIGQMLLVGFRGMEADAESSIAQDIKSGRVGGIILFDYDVVNREPVRNIQSAKQVEALVKQLQSYSKIPLLIAIDQEGGRVNRLKTDYGFPPTVSAAYLGKLDNKDSTQAYADRIATTLNNLGINMNFAPVVDLNINPDNPAIGLIERSYSADPMVVTRNAEWAVEAHRQKGVYTALKHFPGHGSAFNDSHLGITDVTKTWQAAELIPYRAMIKTGMIDMIMTAHIFNAKLDSTYPATLSEKVINGLLRKEIGYNGVVISDDLQMKAIADHFGLEEAVKRSLMAGIDILLFGNNLDYDPEIAVKVNKIIKDLVEKGEISKERIQQSYDRIQTLKATL